MTLAKRVNLAFLALAMALLLARCNVSQVAGGGTETGNPAVAGILYQPDGNTPAAQVTVHIRKQNTLADTTSGLFKTMADTATVTTNDSGIFRVDSIDTGTYAIEGVNGNNLALIDSVKITSTDSTKQVPADTLKPAGAIKGIIRLSEGGDPRKVFVLAFGIDRFARVNADGSFKFNVLAEGKYDLRLISSLDNYGVLDTVNIPVISADTTNLDTIDLPFTGIPTPKNVSITYDTLKQIVTLSWNKADPTLVSGYYVYRRNVDSNTVLTRINTSPITDSLYRDSTGIQDQTYEYRIAAVDKNATEGTKSAGVSVSPISFFKLTVSVTKGAGTTDGEFGYGKLSIDSIRNFIIADNKNKRLEKLDSNGTFVNKYISNDYAADVCVGSNSIFYSEYTETKIMKLASNLTPIDSFTTLNKPSAIIYWFDTLYVATANGLEVYNNGTLVDSISQDFNNSYFTMDLCVSKEGTIFLTDGSKIYKLDKNSNSFLPFFTIPNPANNQNARIELQGNNLLLLTGNAAGTFESTVYVIDLTSAAEITEWVTIEDIRDIFVETNGAITGITSDGKIIRIK